MSFYLSFEMNILLFTAKYIPNVGGLETCVNNLAKQYRKDQTCVLTNRYPKELKGFEVIDGIETYRYFFLPLIPPTANLFVFIKYFLGIFFIPLSCVKLFLLIKKKHIQLVHVHFVYWTVFYLLVVRLFVRIKIVVSLHGDDVHVFPSESILSSFLFSSILHKADFVTACSNSLLEDAIKIVPSIQYKSKAVPNGLNVEEFKNKKSYEYKRPYIFSMGRFIEKKGFDILIEAMKIARDKGHDLCLILAGDGPLWNDYETLINKYHLENHVHLYGPANNAEKASLLKGCELFVLPSRREPFGIVILEAFASKKPVIAARVNGTPEIIQDGSNGVLVGPGNPELLSEGIINLLANEDLSNKIAVEGFETVQNKYKWNKISGQYLSLYDRIIHK